MFSCEFCEIFKDIFFYRAGLLAASDSNLEGSYWKVYYSRMFLEKRSTMKIKCILTESHLFKNFFVYFFCFSLFLFKKSKQNLNKSLHKI